MSRLQVLILMNNKILITGTAGFIGFHLVNKLTSENYDIVGIDNINDYYDVNLKYARLNETGINKDKIEYGKEVQSEKSGLSANIAYIRQQVKRNSNDSGV